jgi:hypothetical protein
LFQEWLLQKLEAKGIDGVQDFIKYLHQQQQVSNSQGASVGLGHGQPSSSGKMPKTTVLCYSLPFT